MKGLMLLGALIGMMAAAGPVAAQITSSLPSAATASVQPVVWRGGVRGYGYYGPVRPYAPAYRYGGYAPRPVVRPYYGRPYVGAYMY